MLRICIELGEQKSILVTATKRMKIKSRSGKEVTGKNSALVKSIKKTNNNKQTDNIGYPVISNFFITEKSMSTGMCKIMSLTSDSQDFLSIPKL